jgi:hypothetical protein
MNDESILSVGLFITSSKKSVVAAETRTEEDLQFEEDES